MVWKSVHGFEGKYQISYDGTVRSMERVVKNKDGTKTVNERVLKPWVDTWGYKRVCLYKNGKPHQKGALLVEIRHIEDFILLERRNMTMPKNKGIYRFFRTKEELQRHDEEIRHFTRVFTLDHVTVALGRMGFRESKFRELDRVLTEVFQEYMADYSDDLKDDKAMEYSRACLDRELKQYTGKFFVPEEERYK